MRRKAVKLINKITLSIFENTKPEERKSSLKNFRKNFKREWMKNPDFKFFLKSNVN